VSALVATRPEEFNSLLGALSESPLTYEAKRVVTLEQVALLLGVTLEKVQQAWKDLRAKKRKDGSRRIQSARHFFRVTGEEFKDLRRVVWEYHSSSVTLSKFANSLTLVTEQGFARLIASSFQDNEVAEDLRDEVVDGYFRVREQLPARVEEIAKQSFQAGADFAAAHHGAEIERLRQSVNYLVEEHQAQKTKTAAAASEHARELSHRKAEKRREVRTSQVLGEVAGALDPGRQLGDELGQGYLFRGLSHAQLANMLYAAIAGSAQGALPVGGAA